MRLRRVIFVFSLVFLGGCKTTDHSARQPYIGSPTAPINGNPYDPVTGLPTSSTIPVNSSSLTSANCVEGDQEMCDIEYQIFLQVNELRRSGHQGSSFFGLFQKNYSPMSELTFHPQASWVAREWSKEQALSQNIGHSGFGSGARERSYMSKFGQSINFTAENVAMNGGSRSGLAADIARQFMDQWINSSGHLANMMGNHGFIAIGVAKNSSGYYATQIFGR